MHLRSAVRSPVESGCLVVNPRPDIRRPAKPSAGGLAAMRNEDTPQRKLLKGIDSPQKIHNSNRPRACVRSGGFYSTPAQFERWNGSMRLQSRRALTSISYAAGIAVVLSLGHARFGDSTGTTKSRIDLAVSAIANEILVRPAYAKKKKKNDHGETRDRNSKKSNHEEWPAAASRTPVRKARKRHEQGCLRQQRRQGQGQRKDRHHPRISANAKNETGGKPGTPAPTEDIDDDAPAATVQEVFKKFAQPAPKRRRAPTIDDFDPDLNFKSGSSEVLATGMDAAALQKAKDLGFATATNSNMPGLGLNVTKLVAPAHNGRNVALELLRAQVIHGRFEKNHTYVIYAPADSTENPVTENVPQPGTRTGQCREDRCIGRAAICWNERLSRCARARSRSASSIHRWTSIIPPSPAGKSTSAVSWALYTRSAADWHGTAVLSLLSGSMDSGVPGLAPDAEYFVAETFRTDEQGYATTDTISILKALAWLESQNVMLVNMSFSGPKDVLVEQAIQRMRGRGVTFVAAAGNFGPTAAPSYPAAYKEVIAVTAITKDGGNYPSANRGDYVDLAAPGVQNLDGVARQQGRFPHRNIVRSTFRHRNSRRDAQSQNSEEGRDRRSACYQDRRSRSSRI